MIDRLLGFLRKWRTLRHDSHVGRISFAQEGEDVLLWRLMDGHHEPSRFVEVGCHHPFRHSNTAFLYRRGWRGLAIDPNPAFEAEFRRSRPGDTYLCSAVGTRAGTAEYFMFDEPLYNTLSGERAHDLQARGAAALLGRVMVPVTPLAALLARAWPGGCTIRFLSIDCEGADLDVVRSHDFDRYPVDFICVETRFGGIGDALDEEMVAELRKLAFLPVAKLWKSMLLVHQRIALSWGLHGQMFDGPPAGPRPQPVTRG